MNMRLFFEYFGVRVEQSPRNTPPPSDQTYSLQVTTVTVVSTRLETGELEVPQNQNFNAQNVHYTGHTQRSCSKSDSMTL